MDKKGIAIYINLILPDPDPAIFKPLFKEKRLALCSFVEQVVPTALIAGIGLRHHGRVVSTDALRCAPQDISNGHRKFTPGCLSDHPNTALSGRGA
jgi:hypothetical protein